MKKVSLLTILLAIASFTFAQSITPEVVSNGGDYFANSSCSIAWTIGEPMVETAVGTNNTLTQGFHQGLYTLVNIEKQIVNTKINVYPNPTSDFINIDITGANSSGYQIQLFDNLGKLLVNKSYENCKHISLQEYAKSTYYLRVLNTTDDKFDSYKILKK